MLSDKSRKRGQILQKSHFYVKSQKTRTHTHREQTGGYQRWGARVRQNG